jgi:hemerythrin
MRWYREELPAVAAYRSGDLQVQNLFVWSETYRLGVRQIDDDHEKLFGLMSAAADAVWRRSPIRSITSKLDAVLEHAQTHFATEEQLMANSAYGQQERHKQEHWLLLEQILEVKGRYAAGEIEAIEMCTYLVDWLIDHIAKSDRPLAAHLQAHAQHAP